MTFKMKEHTILFGAGHVLVEQTNLPLILLKKTVVDVIWIGEIYMLYLLFQQSITVVPCLSINEGMTSFPVLGMYSGSLLPQSDLK